MASSLSLNPSVSLANILRIATQRNKKFVVVYLEGGIDNFQTLVPLGLQSRINQVRPLLALPESSILNLSNSDLGLHPSLTNMNTLYDENKVAIIQTVGYDGAPNASHFASLDNWTTATTTEQVESTGWIGRFFGQTDPQYPVNYPNDDCPHPLSIDLGNPTLIFNGPNSNVSYRPDSPDAFSPIAGVQIPNPPDTPSGNKLRIVQRVFEQTQVYGQRLRDRYEAGSPTQSYPDTRLGNQLRIVSTLLSGGVETPVFYTDIGSFDFHGDMVSANDPTVGNQANLLTELDDAIYAFQRDLEQQNKQDDVIMLLFTEFGRKIQGNNSLGSDHGRAAPMFIIGNQVNGGIFGENPTIPDGTLDWDAALDHEFDMRQVYSSVLEQWLIGEGDSFTSSDILLNQEFKTLPLIGQNTLLASRELARKTIIYPNPITNRRATIEVNSTGEYFSIELADMAGRKIKGLYSGRIAEGRQQVNLDLSGVGVGNYLVLVKSSSVPKGISLKVLVI
jgi:uncharacterized protein (DUF1501 family)